jgi:hypothetical protein
MTSEQAGLLRPRKSWVSVDGKKVKVAEVSKSVTGDGYIIGYFDSRSGHRSYKREKLVTFVEEWA